MTTIDPTSDAGEQAKWPVIAWMDDFRRRVRARFMLDGIARLAAALVGLALLTFLLDRFFRLSPAARYAMVVVSAVGLAVVCWRELIAPLRLKLDPLTLASALDRGAATGRITAQVASVMGLPELLRGPAPPSPAMVRDAVERCYRNLSQLDFNSRMDQGRRNLSATVLGAACVLPLFLTIVAPATVRLWAARTFLGSNQPWPQKTYLQLAGLNDGEIVVPRGEPFVLRVSAIKGSVVPDRVSLRLREGGGSRVNANLTAFGPNDFRYDSSGIRAAATVELWGGDDYLGPMTIRPADRPRVVDLALVTQHPTEQQPQTHTFTGEDADLSFLPETRMELRFAANTPIASAKITSSTTQPTQADLRRMDDRRFAVRWIQQADVHLQIDLLSRDAGLASTPTEVAIGLKSDRPPRVTLSYSGVRPRVTARATIPLAISAVDDYGVAHVSLATKFETPDATDPSKLKAADISTDLFGPIKPTSELQVDRQHTLQLEAMKLPPGSLVTISAAATDDCYTGPQTTRSRQVAFRIVPAEELFREILLRQQAERARFRKQTDQARVIQEQLQTAGSDTSFSDITRRFRAIQHESVGVATTLSDTVTEMRLNALGTDQALELIQMKVLSPLKTLNDTMGAQKDALETLAGTASPALAEAKQRQGEIVSQMELILKQMSQWDSFIDVLNQLNEIIRLQNQAEQTTNQLKKQQTEGIFDK